MLPEVVELIPGWAVLRIHARCRRLPLPSRHVGLRDVQDYAGDKDPRTTRRYDHSRDSLDRNAAYVVAAYLA